MVCINKEDGIYWHAGQYIRRIQRVVDKTFKSGKMRRTKVVLWKPDNTDQEFGSRLAAAAWVEQNNAHSQDSKTPTVQEHQQTSADVSPSKNG